MGYEVPPPWPVDNDPAAWRAWIAEMEARIRRRTLYRLAMLAIGMPLLVYLAFVMLAK